MALHPQFPTSPHVVLDPAIRWFPADETLRETRMDNLLPPLVPELRTLVKAWRDKKYPDHDAAGVSRIQKLIALGHRPPGTQQGRVPAIQRG
jgi:type III restriction enzyme